MLDLEAPLSPKVPLVSPAASRETSRENRGPPFSFSASPQEEQLAPDQQQQTPLQLPLPPQQEQQQQQQQQQEYEEVEGGLQYQHEAVDVDLPPGSEQAVPRAPYPRPYDSAWRLAFLLFVAAGPFLGMLLFISLLKNVGAAMLFMHWFCMVLAPAVYIQFASDGWAYCKHVYMCQGPGGGRWRRQGPWAFAALIGGAGVVYVGFKFLWFAVRAAGGGDMLGDMQQRLIETGMGGPLWISVLLSIYFITVNPIIEELFWRVFLYRELGAGMFGSAAAGLLYVKEAQPLVYKMHQAWRIVAGGPLSLRHHNTGGAPRGPPNIQDHEALVPCPPQHPKNIKTKFDGDTDVAMTAEETPYTLSSAEAAAAAPAAAAAAPTAAAAGQSEAPAAAAAAAVSGGLEGSSNNTRSIAYYDLKVPLTGLLALAAAYGSYHMVVIHSLMGAAYVVPAFIAISFLGAVLLYLRNKERFGLLTATGLHAGVDVGVVLVLGEALRII